MSECEAGAGGEGEGEEHISGPELWIWGGRVGVLIRPVTGVCLRGLREGLGLAARAGACVGAGLGLGLRTGTGAGRGCDKV